MKKAGELYLLEILQVSRSKKVDLIYFIFLFICYFHFDLFFYFSIFRKN